MLPTYHCQELKAEPLSAQAGPPSGHVWGTGDLQNCYTNEGAGSPVCWGSVRAHPLLVLQPAPGNGTCHGTDPKCFNKGPDEPSASGT